MPSSVLHAREPFLRGVERDTGQRCQLRAQRPVGVQVTAGVKGVAYGIRVPCRPETVREPSGARRNSSAGECRRVVDLRTGAAQEAHISGVPAPACRLRIRSRFREVSTRKRRPSTLRSILLRRGEVDYTCRRPAGRHLVVRARRTRTTRGETGGGGSPARTSECRIVPFRSLVHDPSFTSPRCRGRIRYTA
ncbi:hypothetical protein SGM_4937 [Streptomyces griseoaurantiacus M045]|uniref:Uncharacterized protein n=1 Tax=Streptomyces griseoaurantiacus M045 TaxID=996637 RepID=F3NP73_9ACTN|nr:hypothetical protein SGM_4937 [Streptomyces griseoaurantiacus M045]